MTYNPGGPIRAFIVSLMGVATLVAGLLFIRHHRDGDAETELTKHVPAGEKSARKASLERFRELGV